MTSHLFKEMEDFHEHSHRSVTDQPPEPLKFLSIYSFAIWFILSTFSSQIIKTRRKFHIHSSVPWRASRQLSKGNPWDLLFPGGKDWSKAAKVFSFFIENKKGFLQHWHHVPPRDKPLRPAADQRLLQKAQAQNLGQDKRVKRDCFSFNALLRTSSRISVLCQAIILEKGGDQLSIKKLEGGREIRCFHPC